ncbi:40S ribosomal protein S10-2 [Zea mays]|uniref:40S ribosomal protein S10-2 n=1 Tax=Zea mays TaxID=4577 RepID=A0A317Y8W5_MAIZE|nr:40S ribosomal protein S10-2 [Zea mays]
MGQKPSYLLLLVGLLAIAMLCAGPGHALCQLNDANGGGLEFSLGSKAATAGAKTEPLDPSLSDDYENEGVLYAKKDYNLAKHPQIDVPNLQDSR